MWLDPYWYIVIIVGGLIEFIAYKRFEQWVFKNYGNWYLFWHFAIKPLPEGVTAERRDEEKRRFDAIYRTTKQ